MEERLKQQLDFILEIDKEKNILRQKNLLKRQPQRSLDYCTRESIYSKDRMTEIQFENIYR